MQVRKIPIRMCVGCGEHKEKRELIRVVKSPEGTVALDFTGKATGRGAYICPTPECFKKAVKAHRFENAFGTSIQEDVFEALQKELENGQ